jgi:nitrite reductase (NADH) small subunit
MTAVGPTRSELALDGGLDARDPAHADAGRWSTVCPVGLLTPGRGVAALVDGTQVAVFLLPSGEVLAIDDRDPCSGVDVLSRGLIGDVAGEPTVASPIYKQRFGLRTGRCLDDEAVSVQTWVVQVRDGQVEVAGP